LRKYHHGPYGCQGTQQIYLPPRQAQALPNGGRQGSAGGVVAVEGKPPASTHCPGFQFADVMEKAGQFEHRQPAAGASEGCIKAVSHLPGQLG